MNYILATFNSRNETLAYVRQLRNGGLYCEVINTPSALGGGCSISAKLPSSALAMAQRILGASRFVTFRGFYYLYNQNGRQIVERI